MAGDGIHGCLDESIQLRIVADHGHGAPTQNKGRPHQHRVTDLASHGVGGFERVGDAVIGAGDVELIEEGGEFFAVFGQADGGGRGAQDGHTGLLEALGQIEGRLPAELQDDSDGLLTVDHIEDVLQGHRLKVQPVGGVVVGGDSLGVAVEHDDFIAAFREGKGGLAAAVIELDALTDAVGPATEDEDFAAVHGRGFIFGLIGTVQVGGL